MPVKDPTQREEWSCLYSNQLFSLEELKVGSNSLRHSALALFVRREQAFRIVLKGDESKEDVLLVAGNGWNEMKECWEWIEQNIVANVAYFEQCAEHDGIGTAAMQSLLKHYFEREYKGPLMNKDKLVYYTDICEQLIDLNLLRIDEAVEERIRFIHECTLKMGESGSKYNLNRTNSDVSSQNFSHCERSAIVCLTERNIFIVGKDANAFGCRISLMEIENMQFKSDSRIVITTLDKCFDICVGSKTKQCFDILLDFCNLSVRQLGNLSVYSTSNDNSEMLFKNHSQDDVKSAQFLEYFWMLSNSIQIIATFECACSIEPLLLPQIRGELYLTEQLLCFCSKAHESASFILPYSQIVSFGHSSRDKFFFGKREEAHIKTVQGKLFNFQTKNCKPIIELISKQKMHQVNQTNLTIAEDNIQQLNCGLLNLKAAKSLPSQFSKLGITDQVLLKSSSMFSIVCFKGFPPELRFKIWPLLCYSSQNSTPTTSEKFKEMAKKCVITSCVSFEEIERDLKRSLPNHVAYQSEAGINSLREILCVFAREHPSVGYIQGMNIIAATLLLYLPSYATFDVLRVLFVNAFPEQYCSTLVGSVVDQKVFERLLQEMFPRLHRKFHSLSIQVSMLTISWFVCFFLSVLPTAEDCHRWLDCFLWEGPLLLFRFALAVFDCNSQPIMQARDDDELLQIIKGFFTSTRYSFRRLIQLATSPRYVTDVNFARVQELRKQLRISTVHEMGKTQQRITVKRLHEQFPLLSQAEVETIFSTVQRIFLLAGKTGIHERLSFVDFYEILKYVLPEWCTTCSHSNSLCLLIYQYFSPNNDYLVVFELYQTLRRQRLKEKLRFLYSLHLTGNETFDWERFTTSMSSYLCIDGKWAAAIKTVNSFDDFVEVSVGSLQFMQLLSEK